MLSNEREFKKALDEREQLRPDRARNYRIKFRDGYRCTYDHCTAETGLVAIRNRQDVDSDDAYTTRCVRHVFKAKPCPGQWVGR